MNGLFLIAREMFDHPIVGISNPKRFAAWCWIVSEARYKESTILVSGKPVKLNRGQLSCSIRFMASRCGMSIKEARTFLEKLKKMEMIVIKTDTGQNLITICNYEVYQDFENYRAQQGHSKGTARAQTRTKETKETKETKDIGFVNEEILKAYNLFVDTAKQYNLAKPSKLNNGRKRAIKARLKEFDFESWEKAIANIATSDFLKGKVKPTNGHRQFKLDIDWFCKPSNFIAIFEGKYNNDKPKVKRL